MPKKSKFHKFKEKLENLKKPDFSSFREKLENIKTPDFSKVKDKIDNLSYNKLDKVKRQLAEIEERGSALGENEPKTEEIDAEETELFKLDKKDYEEVTKDLSHITAEIKDDSKKKQEIQWETISTFSGRKKQLLKERNKKSDLKDTYWVTQFLSVLKMISNSINLEKLSSIFEFPGNLKFPIITRLFNKMKEETFFGENIFFLV